MFLLYKGHCTKAKLTILNDQDYLSENGECDMTLSALEFHIYTNFKLYMDRSHMIMLYYFFLSSYSI